MIIQKYPLETLISNAYGTKNLLYLVLKYKAKMVQVSSSAVYGSPYYEDPYFREDYWGYVDQLSPRGIYAEAKRYAESLIAAFYRSYKLDMKIARVFNVYGPRMRYTDHRLIPDLIRQSLGGADDQSGERGGRCHFFVLYFRYCGRAYQDYESSLHRSDKSGKSGQSDCARGGGNDQKINQFFVRYFV